MDDTGTACFWNELLTECKCDVTSTLVNISLHQQAVGHIVCSNDLRKLYHFVSDVMHELGPDGSQ